MFICALRSGNVLRRAEICGAGGAAPAARAGDLHGAPEEHYRQRPQGALWRALCSPHFTATGIGRGVLIIVRIGICPDGLRVGAVRRAHGRGQAEVHSSLDDIHTRRTLADGLGLRFSHPFTGWTSLVALGEPLSFLLRHIVLADMWRIQLSRRSTKRRCRCRIPDRYPTGQKRAYCLQPHDANLRTATWMRMGCSEFCARKRVVVYAPI